MSIKKIFNKNDELKTILTSADIDAVGKEVESAAYVKSFLKDKDRFVPHVDFSSASNFVKFGSAEQYYEDAIKRIYKTYPYDGSLKEKLDWHNSSSYFENYIFENRYPTTTGYIIFSAEGWGTKQTASDKYSSSSVGEYILFKGGPHPSKRSKGKEITDGTGDYKSGYSNYFNISQNRESNLKIGGTDGNTVEFWMKKDAFDSTNKTEKEVIFDTYTANAAYTADGYGRMRIELTGHDTDQSTLSPFLLTYMSGNAGFSSAYIGSGVTTATVADGAWHHYAFTVANSGSNLQAKLYVDGKCNHTITGGTATAATLANAIDVTGVANDHAFTLTSPVAMGGDGVTYTFKFVHGLNEVNAGASGNVYYISRHSDAGGTTALTTAQRATALANAINGVASPYAAFSDGNVTSVNSVDLKITADASAGDGTIDLTFDVAGITGNEQANVLAATNGFTGDLILEDAFTGGTNNLAQDDSTATIDYVSGAMVATIGALATAPSGTSTPDLGWGKFSGSLDEFRFWKTERNAQEIGRYWIGQVGGGANNDKANTDLGVYYKFNEGIVGSTIPDKTVLDYSGRISNGTWFGYTATSRNTGSAIVSASITGVGSEIEDPILYSGHSKVDGLLTSSILIGREYDYRNNASLYHSFPQWIVDEDDDKTLKKLTQVISTYLDTLYLQIQELPRIKNVNYLSGNYKPYPFTNKLLESKGFVAPDLFPDVEIIEYFLNRGEKEFFVEKLYNVKNKIYQNIYNNLSHIYKSKGTEKAFRNLIRCYGVGHELLKLNLYGDNVTYNFEDNFSSVTVKKKAVDFNHPDRYDATVYQFTGSANSNSTSFISGTAAQVTASVPMTLEASVIFPKKFHPREAHYRHTPFLTSSLFGMHTARSNETDTPPDMTWYDTDPVNFQVYAIRKTDSANIINGEGYNRSDAYFMLTSSATVGSVIPELTSSVFSNVYDNSKWNFAVRIRPTNYPFAGHAPYSFDSNTTGSHTTYNVEFYGVNSHADVITDEFLVTGTIPLDRGIQFMTSSKRLYLGAHRTNFTGSVLNSSDVKISSARYWQSYLENGAIKAHARDPENFGTLHPYRSAYLFEDKNLPVEIPQINTLVLNWDFETLSSSSGGRADGYYGGSAYNANFVVDDVSSGSVHASTLESWTGSFGWLGNIVKRQHTGRGDFFLPNATGSISREYIHSAKQNLPENLYSSDTIKVLSRDDEVFTRETRPTTHFFAVEKSMHQIISQEMLNLFATIVDFNNLIGEPVNRYRQDYKDLGKLRQFFFEKVQNTPDAEKFFDYYKWIDSALSKMILQLMPASARHADKIRNIIESHILERNKYWAKFPTFDDLSPDNTLEATPGAKTGGGTFVPEPPHIIFDPQLGPLPVQKSWTNLPPENFPLTDVPGDSSMNFNSAQFDQDKSDTHQTSGDANVDNDRNIIAKAVNTKTNTKTTANADIISDDGSRTPSTHTPGALIIDPIIDYSSPASSVETDADDDEERTDSEKQKNQLTVGPTGNPYDTDRITGYNPGDLTHGKDRIKGKATGATFGANSIARKLAFPFAIRYSNASGGYIGNISSGYSASVDITNLHHDTYGVFKNIPLQGPFTEKFVGGGQHRHRWSHLSLDTLGTRPEAWKLSLGEGKITISKPGTLNSSATFAGVAALEDDNGTELIIRNAGTSGASVTFTTDSSKAATASTATKIGTSGVNTAAKAAQSMHVAFAAAISAGTLKMTLSPATYSGETEITLTQNLVSTSGNTEITVPANITVQGGASGEDRYFTQSLAQHPRAQYKRDEYAKRPVNIRNIKQTTGSAADGFYTNIGNYKEDRDIVQSSGRGVNNRNFVKNEGINVEWLDSQKPDSEVLPFYGIPEYTTINRAVTGSNKFIFVERFSAPGDPVTMCHGMLDIESGEKSVYNALPWRNLSVRLPLYEFLPNHTKQFGFYSDAQYSASWALAAADGLKSVGSYPGLSGSVNALNYQGSASFHKTNRNTRRVLKYSNEYTMAKGIVATASVYDNWFIQHPIPQSDMQYQWITGAATNSILGYETKDHTNASQASTDITFVLESDVENTNSIKIDFAGMNNVIIDPLQRDLNTVSSSTNIYNNTNLGTITAPNTLNAILLNRNGPTQYPSWKQIRNGDHQIVRDQRKNNVLSIVEGAGRKGGSFLHLTESAVTSRYLPMEHVLVPMGAQQPVLLKHTYANNLGTFANRKFVEKLNTYILGGDQTYDELRKLYLNNSMPSFTPEFVSFSYKETIWPREVNAFLDKARNRKNFIYPWKDARTNRTQTDVANSVNETITSQSMWPLDPRPNFESAGAPAVTPSGEGSLMRANVIFHSGSTAQAGPLYAYPCFDAHEKGALGTVYGSQTLWEAGAQSGKNPFYNTYSDYNDDIRRVGKDFSIIPEFNLSRDHLEDYLDKEGGNFFIDRENILTLSGAAEVSGSNEDGFFEIYAHGDPMMPFDIIRNHHKDFAEPSEIKLTCKALMKFLPYDGFYPAQRTVQLVQLFSQSYAHDVFKLTKDLYGNSIEDSNMRTFYQPLFSPGILYNTIKSGLSVDWPVHTDLIPTASFTGSTANNTEDDCGAGAMVLRFPRIGSDFNKRIPFEALVDPKSYLAGVNIADSNPHPSQSLGSMVRWGGSEKSSKYRLAMHNFLAESADFFLGGLTTFESPPDTDQNFFFFEEEKPYMMDVLLYRTHDHSKYNLSTAYDAVHMIAGDDIPSTMEMYSNPGAFGPLVDQTFVYSGSAVTGAARSPYLPPYYNGTARARLSFTPYNGPGRYTVAEIITHMTATYSRVVGTAGTSQYSTLAKNASWSAPDATAVFSVNLNQSPEFHNYGDTPKTGLLLNKTSSVDHKNAMHVSGCLNLFQIINQPDIKVADDAVETTIGGYDKGARWAIQPKFETVVLNFSGSARTLSTPDSGSNAKGMWHQYGAVPTGRDGIFIEIAEPTNHHLFGDPYTQTDTSNVRRETVVDTDKTGSLAVKCGFISAGASATLKKIGVPRKDNEVSLKEAIVLIPFIKEVNSRTSAPTTRFFNLNKNTVKKALKAVRGNIPQPESGVSKSIYNTISAMTEYVIPPKFDFVTQMEANHSDARPFTMYFLEFEHRLSRKDLTDIWQNLPPDIGTSFKESETTISHKLLKSELMKEVAETDLHWIVFKVKKKAKQNYYELTSDTLDDALFKFDIGERRDVIPTYSYNWPYDYCSLVELAKIDAEVKFEKIGKEIVTVTTTTTTTEDDTTITEEKTTTTEEGGEDVEAQTTIGFGAPMGTGNGDLLN